MSVRSIHAAAALVAAIAGACAGCSRRTSARVPPPVQAPVRAGDIETGIASWYGAPYDGRRAASGEIYDMQQFTAAHRTLPFGTWVEVTDLDNGKRVEVRITDRGPFVDGRVIDLSQAAARRIEMLGPGTARVQLKVIAPAGRVEEAPAPEIFVKQESYAVQAGAFSNRDRAESFRASLAFDEARVVGTSTVWRVLIGRQMSLDAANRLAEKVRGAVGQAVVVRDQ